MRFAEDRGTKQFSPAAAETQLNSPALGNTRGRAICCQCSSQACRSQLSHRHGASYHSLTVSQIQRVRNVTLDARGRMRLFKPPAKFGLRNIWCICGYGYPNAYWLLQLEVESLRSAKCNIPSSAPVELRQLDCFKLTNRRWVSAKQIF